MKIRIKRAWSGLTLIELVVFFTWICLVMAVRLRGRVKSLETAIMVVAGRCR